MRSEPSRADERLAAEVRSLDPAAWQVTGGWIQACHERYGVLEPSQRWPGKVRGSESSYPPGTAKTALRFYRLMRALRSVDAAAIALFLGGSPVGERAIKRALRWTVSGMPVQGDDAPATRARRIAVEAARDRSAAGRALRQFLGVRGKELENVLQPLAASALGQPAPVDPSRRSTPLLVRSLHLDEAWAEDARSTAAVLNSRMGHATADDLTKLLDEATIGDLERARSALGPLPLNAIEQVKPGLRKHVAMFLAGALLSRLRDQVFEREATKATTI